MAKMLQVFKAANRNHIKRSISQLTVGLRAMAGPNYTTLAAPISTELKLPGDDERLMVANIKTTTIDNPCLDLFFNVVKLDRNSPPAEVEASLRYLKRLLPPAWSHNPLTTLKLIWNLLQNRRIYGKSYRDGKAYAEGFYTAAYWLHKNHPKTLACNIEPIPEWFGSHFYLVDFLLRLLEGRDRMSTCGSSGKTTANKKSDQREQEEDYRLLHDRVSDLFVENLKSDIESLKQSHTNDCSTCIGEAAVSCLCTWPSYVHAFRTTMMCESIARKFFPRAEYQGVAEADYAAIVLNRLRNEVLVPLEKAFRSPRNERPPPGTEGEYRSCVVEKYLEEVKAGKRKILADALLPHEIIHHVPHWTFGKVAELQWTAMVEDVKKKGKMNNCLAVCDINSTFKDEISIAMGLLLSELSEEPWRGKVINHGGSPELQLIQGDDLRYKCESVRRLYPINRFRDFEMLFDLILEVAVNENLKPEQMIRKVFVFSHRDYDYKIYGKYHTSSDWKTEYEEIHLKFKERGYGDVVPHLVFWTLSDYKATEPVRPSAQPGLTILTGFSDDLLKLFLDNDGDVSPDLIMEAAISGNEYQSLVVVD